MSVFFQCPFPMAHSSLSKKLWYCAFLCYLSPFVISLAFLYLFLSCLSFSIFPFLVRSPRSQDSKEASLWSFSKSFPSLY
jgi:hypothetical protein